MPKVEKLGARLDRAQTEKDRLETKLESSQSELGKSKAELDKAASEVGRSGADWEAAKQRLSRLELENERLRHEIEKSTSTTTASFTRTAHKYDSSPEVDRIQDRAEKTAQELRRAQAELRVTQADNERAKAEAAALQEKVIPLFNNYLFSSFHRYLYKLLTVNNNNKIKNIINIEKK